MNDSVQSFISAGDVANDNPIRKCLAVCLPPLDDAAPDTTMTALDWMAAQSRNEGFTDFFIGFFPDADKPAWRENMLSTSWNDGFLDNMDSRGEFANSAVISLSKLSTFPQMQPNENLFANVGLRLKPNSFLEKQSLIFSLYNSVGKRYIFILSAPAAVFATFSVKKIYIAAMEFVDRHLKEDVAAGTATSGKKKRPLSGREIECLRWAAEGKTTEVISSILGISAHTVNLYFQTGIEKLAAVNRTQAVAKAMRAGLI